MLVDAEASFPLLTREVLGGGGEEADDDDERGDKGDEGERDLWLISRERAFTCGATSTDASRWLTPFDRCALLVALLPFGSATALEVSCRSGDAGSGLP